MELTNPLKSVNHDGEGRPYRYRKGVYPTLHWLMCHPDGGKQPGLFMHIWLQIALSLISLVVLVWTVPLVRSMSQPPALGLDRYLSAVMLPTMLILFCYLHARWMRRFAIAIDLKSKICPACGYPLTLESNEESLTDSICTECGRRWTSTPRRDVPPKHQSDSEDEATG